MRQHECGVGCKCAQHLCRASVTELVKAATQLSGDPVVIRLAITFATAWFVKTR
jgi:hypothetical protein